MLSTFHITDRRLNPNGKNLSNRQRFFERVKKKIETSAAKGLKNRKIGDEGDTEISISRDGIDEPQFQYDYEHGTWDHMLPGNKNYNVGDSIPRPSGGAGGRSSEGATDGDGDDDFRFALSNDEFINAIFGDLSLPDMVKESNRHVVQFVSRRAGFTTVGAACNLALERTMIQGIQRRRALKTPKLVRVMELEEELETEEDERRRLEIEGEITDLIERAKAIPFLDKSDLRYHNTTKEAVPITQAVMFCLMDVSGSMTEHMKDLAKRFYVLLYIFLKRQYKDVDVVFIRHTHMATEVDEDTFFHSPETGGTIVSTAYDEMIRVIKDRYAVDQWNMYCAQASDGDNSGGDNEVSRMKLIGMLPWLQYYTYIEVGRDEQHYPPGFVHRTSELWQTIEEVKTIFPNKIAMRKISNKGEIVEVFRSLFKKRQET